MYIYAIMLLFFCNHHRRQILQLIQYLHALLKHLEAVCNLLDGFLDALQAQHDSPPNLQHVGDVLHDLIGNHLHDLQSHLH